MAASSPSSLHSLHQPLIASVYEPLPSSHLYPAVPLSPPPPTDYVFNFSRSAFDDIAKRNHPLFHKSNNHIRVQRPLPIHPDNDVQDQLRAMHAAERAEVERARLRAARADHAEAIAAARPAANPQAAVSHVRDELCGAASQRFVRHLVVATDDIVDLAVRYRTSVEVIRRHNRRVVFDYLDNVMGEFILVPVTDDFELPSASADPVRSGNDDELLIPGCGGLTKAQLEAQSQRNRQFFAVRSFCLQANRGVSDVRSHCSEMEAKFYLEENNFDVSAALAAYRDDIEWEKVEKTKKAATPKQSTTFSHIVRDMAETKALRMRAAISDSLERAQLERELEARKQRRKEIRRRLEEAKMMRAINPSPPPAPVRVYRNVGEGYTVHSYTNAVLN